MLVVYMWCVTYTLAINYRLVMANIVGVGGGGRKLVLRCDQFSGKYGMLLIVTIITNFLCFGLKKTVTCSECYRKIGVLWY